MIYLILQKWILAEILKRTFAGGCERYLLCLIRKEGTRIFKYIENIYEKILPHTDCSTIVWIPKYRKSVLRGKIVLRLKRLLDRARNMIKWRISELSIQEDHVHIIIKTKPRGSVPEGAQRLKGGASRVIRKE